MMSLSTARHLLARRHLPPLQDIVRDFGPTVSRQSKLSSWPNPSRSNALLSRDSPSSSSCSAPLSLTPIQHPVSRTPLSVPAPVPETTADAASPYVDYGRWLTAEGGILILYKDLDTRFRHTLWHLFAWTVSTGWEGWYVLHHSPVHTPVDQSCLSFG